MSIYIFEKLWISKYDTDLDSKIHSNIGLDFKWILNLAIYGSQILLSLASKFGTLGIKLFGHI